MLHHTMNAAEVEELHGSLVAQEGCLGEQDKRLQEVTEQVHQLSAGFSEVSKHVMATVPQRSNLTLPPNKPNKFNDNLARLYFENIGELLDHQKLTGDAVR